MNKPQRKPLRLQRFDYSSAGAYFLTLCIQDRRCLLGKIVQIGEGAVLQGYENHPGKMVEKWLHELENKFDNLHLDQYTIMPNHVHMILFLDGSNTSADVLCVMDWLKTMTTNEYIRGVRTGLYPPFRKKLWQRGYYDHVIRNDRDLDECRKYILENPQKWMLDELYRE